MFGPNYEYTPVTPSIYCHRSKEFARMTKELKQRFVDLFGLGEYDIVFIPGPATVAMQTVIDSLPFVDVIGSGKFADRWRGMAERHISDRPVSDWRLFVQLETSASALSGFVGDSGLKKCNSVVDAVSAFPYYRLPENCDIFVTTSCKQLGGPPGLAIVGIRKTARVLFKTDWDYTTILNHIRDDFYTTAPVNVIEHLFWRLTENHVKDTNEKINGVCAMLDPVLPADVTMGNRLCPVITLDKKAFDERFPGVAKQWKLYPECRQDETDRYHIFTYSAPLSDYDRFAKELKCL